jgi:HSP20 family protein
MTMDMTQPQVNREASAPKRTTQIPAVDIFEDENGVTLRADLPGVSRENLSLRIDGDTLTVEGDASFGASPQPGALYAEVPPAQFRRSFLLSRDLDTSKIEAAVKNGVLTLTVPKAEQAKPRRIEVRAAA